MKREDTVFLKAALDRALQRNRFGTGCNMYE
jgi:hypothetical protein